MSQHVTHSTVVVEVTVELIAHGHTKETADRMVESSVRAIRQGAFRGASKAGREWAGLETEVRSIAVKSTERRNP